MEGFTSMSAKFFVVPNRLRGWFRFRAERKAAWMATDEVSKSPDGVLSDIGISRDDVIGSLHNCRNLNRPTKKGKTG